VRFGNVPLDEAQGSLLAHSHKSSTGRIRKGQLLTADLIEQLRQDGVSQITVAQLSVDDVHEDRAALEIATALAADNTRLGSASTGRVNIHANVDGLCEFNSEEIHAINSIHESITLATLPASTRVVDGQILATIKIIPYATHSDHVQAARRAIKQRLRVHEIHANSVCLIQTELPSIKQQVLDKTRAVTEHRLLERKATLIDEARVAHTEAAVCAALNRALSMDPDWVLVFGASAISDRCDVIPSAITQLGGQIEHFGMPMDPGNLLLLAHIDNTLVIGMPGCGRSKKYNGLDKVLDRMACRVPVTRQWITTLGVGGLLKEIVDRPRPRVIPTEQPTISALLLGAGSSSRFGEQNKLLSLWQGQTLISHVLRAIKNSAADKTVVITGHQSALVAAAIKDAIDAQEIDCIHNEAYRTGMASSLVKGVSALIESDAIVVCLADMPKVDSAVINALVAAFVQHPDKAIYIPTYFGQRGNPVLIGRRLFDSILTLQGDTGARVLAKQFPESVLEVSTDCAGILQDIDTQDELRAFEKQHAGGKNC